MSADEVDGNEIVCPDCWRGRRRDVLLEGEELLIRSELERLALCSGRMSDAFHSGDEIQGHYAFQGMEFAVMRAHWLLGDKDRAIRLHRSIGDHSPVACPVCSGVAAFTTAADAASTKGLQP